MAPKYGGCPNPLVIELLQLPHRQTFILLHGRGSTAVRFGPELLHSSFGEASDPKSLRSCFPHAKFIFPTAPLTRAKLYKRAMTHQWFDRWKHYRPYDPMYGERDELQVPGLKLTTEFLHGLIRHEAAKVGPSNVVIGGLSQGCAAALIALLLWDGPPLGAFVGMCGYLPLEKLLAKDSLGASGELPEGVEGLLSCSEQDTGHIDILRDELGFVGCQSAYGHQRTPVFLGHGVDDDKVFVEEGRIAAQRLQDLQTEKLCFVEYDGLGHWYSAEMLADKTSFLFEHLPS